jgi:hypothetical protein
MLNSASVIPGRPTGPRNARPWNPYALSARLILNYDNELRIFQRSPAGSKTELNPSDGICCPGNLMVAARQRPSTFRMPGSRQRNLS